MAKRKAGGSHAANGAGMVRTHVAISIEWGDFLKARKERTGVPTTRQLHDALRDAYGAEPGAPKEEPVRGRT